MQRGKWWSRSDPSTHTLQKCCCSCKTVSSGSLKASHFTVCSSCGYQPLRLMKQLVTKSPKTQNPLTPIPSKQRRVSDNSCTPFNLLFAGMGIGSLRHRVTGTPHPPQWVLKPLENGKCNEEAERKEGGEDGRR